MTQTMWKKVIIIIIIMSYWVLISITFSILKTCNYMFHQREINLQGNINNTFMFIVVVVIVVSVIYGFT